MEAKEGGKEVVGLEVGSVAAERAEAMGVAAMEGEMVEGTEEGKGVVGGGMAVGMEARAAVSARTIQQP